VPTLRERVSDIPQLALFFLAGFRRKFGRDIKGIPQATLDRLLSYTWPGNIRELQNVIERAVILSRRSVLELDPDLVAALCPPGSCSKTGKTACNSGPAHSASGPATLRELEKAHLITVLTQTGGVIEGSRGAARILDLHPNTLRHRIQKLGLKAS